MGWSRAWAHGRAARRARLEQNGRRRANLIRRSPP
jgi:hypothetical protein